MNHVPLVDLGAQHREIATDVDQGFAEVLGNGDFIGGKAVAAFEQSYAEFIGVRHCIGVGNGTDALEMALRATGVNAGDEVILPANTFIATAEAVVRAGARPVLVDADPDALLINPELVAAAVTDRTVAVMPVHLYGQCAPVELLPPVIADRSIPVIEDAAQAQGAKRFGAGAGTLGDIAGTSFYPGKNLGAYGDAGAVLTSNDVLAKQIRLMGAHGSAAKYEHTEMGFNSRLDTLQAVVLNAKLRRLAVWNQQRRDAASRYAELLGQTAGVVLPVTLEGNQHVWHLYVVQVDDRDAVLARLHEVGVGAGIHYPVPVHLQPAFAFLGYGPGSFPISEVSAGRILSLPIYPGITPQQQEQVAEAVADAVA